MNSSYRIIVVLLAVLAPGLIQAASADLIHPPEVIEVLEAAGDNRGEFEKTLMHYFALGDSLKLEAAYFLIANMPGHSYVTTILVDSTEREIDFHVLDYTDFDHLIASFKEMEEQYGELQFKRDERIKDIEVITADFLINNIDYAFKAWRQKPWARELSFDDFREYILPYRGSNEPLEKWRETFLEKYAWVESRMTNPEDPVEAASIINDDIKEWFRFDPRFYYHPTDQGLSEMLENRMGRCEDMTNLTIYAMRSVGLAVTTDYTPHWANAGNNHAWNAIVTADGRVIPFMGAESNPGQYQLANKVAKAYRKMFSRQEENLIFQERKQEEIPRWLAGKSFTDVTAAYTSVEDVTVSLEKEVPDSIDIAYLCVFNSGKWRAIAWGRTENRQASFVDMGTDVVYLPALYIDEELVPYGAPFVLSDDSAVIRLHPDGAGPITVELISTTRRRQVASTDGVLQSYLTPGQEYELFYWRDEWRSLGRAVASDKPLVFENVPAGGLYWLVADDSDREERIFTIDEDGRQVWW